MPGGLAPALPRPLSALARNSRSAEKAGQRTDMLCCRRTLEPGDFRASNSGERPSAMEGQGQPGIHVNTVKIIIPP